MRFMFIDFLDVMSSFCAVINYESFECMGTAYSRPDLSDVSGWPFQRGALPGVEFLLRFYERDSMEDPLGAYMLG